MQYPNIAQPQYAFAPTMMAQGGSVAQNLASKGRNGDSMLVHMTPGEVGGLQALAMQHGGSLTINPQTGLPEANFLKNLLPTLLGVGLSFIPGVGPLAAGLTVGGIETVRTGDIGKGFMAGLGAYGGANLAGGLKAAGGAASSATAGATGSAEALAAQTAGNQTAAETARLTAANQAAGVGATPPTFMENVAQAGRGVQNIFTNPQDALTRFIGTAGTEADAKRGVEAVQATGLGGGFGAAKTIGMAGAPLIADAMMPKPYEAPVEKDEGFEYEGPYTPSQRRVSYPGEEERRRTSEFTYFTPSNPVPFAEGGNVAPSNAPASEAQVFQNIADIQQMAGLDALDLSRFANTRNRIDLNQFAGTPNRNYEPLVYNPIGRPEPTTLRTGEISYGFTPLLTKAQIEAAEADKKAKEAKKPDPWSITPYQRIQMSKGTPYRLGPDIGTYEQYMSGMTDTYYNPFYGNAKGGEISAPKFAEGGDVAPESGDVFISPNEARVYQDIINTQRLAGLPALDPARFVVMPGRSYEQFVYNPIEGGGGVYALDKEEENFGFTPLLTKADIEAAEAAKKAEEARKSASSRSSRFGGFGAFIGRSNEVVGYTQNGDPVYSHGDPMYSQPVYSQLYNSFNKGGSVPQLEDGGFVLTKKAVDGLGKGSNKKGQQVASAGLGAIPIKGAGAKRGPKAGVDDKIKTTIDGKHPALISNGEAYVPKKQVAKKGGAKAFYALMHKAEKAAEKRKRS